MGRSAAHARTVPTNSSTRGDARPWVTCRQGARARFYKANHTLTRGPALSCLGSMPEDTGQRSHKHWRGPFHGPRFGNSVSGSTFRADISCFEASLARFISAPRITPLRQWPAASQTQPSFPSHLLPGWGWRLSCRARGSGTPWTGTLLQLPGLIWGAGWRQLERPTLLSGSSGHASLFPPGWCIPGWHRAGHMLGGQGQVTPARNTSPQSSVEARAWPPWSACSEANSHSSSLTLS